MFQLPMVNFNQYNTKVYDGDLKVIYSDSPGKTEESKIKVNNKKEGVIKILCFWYIFMKTFF